MSAVAELAAQMRVHGVPCAIAAPAPEARWAGGLEFVPCGAWRVPFGPVVRLPARLPLSRPTVVHVHGLASLAPWSPFLGRARPDAVVGTLHGVLDRRLAVGMGPLRRVWHERLDLPLLRRWDGVHVTRVSEATSAGPHVRAGAPVACLPWTLAEAGRARATRAVPRAPFLLAVGRLHPIKGLDRLLRAFAAAGPRLGSARLLLAGSGRRAHVGDLRALARSLGLRPRVQFLGHVEPDALAALYAEASALVLPSRYENFGMVVLEALRCGCPVVAARETPWACLEETESGRWLDFDDVPAAAAALAEALEPRSRESRGPAARALFAERFAPARVVPRFLAWYRAVLRGRASAVAA